MARQWLDNGSTMVQEWLAYETNSSHLPKSKKMTEKNDIARIASQPESQQLYSDVCEIIDATRTRVAVYVNAEVCHTNWLIGKRIKEDILYNKRAEYGKQVIKNLSLRLTEKYGRGWSDRTLLHCIRAAYTFTEEEIVYAVRRQFSWTHLRSIMFLEDPLARKDIEAFFGKPVFLELFVKVDKDWRSSTSRLRHYGYDLS